jgi:hypothetical protein
MVRQIPVRQFEICNIILTIDVQYTFELVSKLMSDYATAVWDDPVDPFVYTAQTILSLFGQRQRTPVLYADQVILQTPTISGTVVDKFRPQIISEYKSEDTSDTVNGDNLEFNPKKHKKYEAKYYWQHSNEGTPEERQESLSDVFF